MALRNREAIEEMTRAFKRMDRKIDRLLEEVVKLNKRGDKLMAWTDDMRAAISEDASVTQSAVTLLSELADKIQELINNGSDPAELQGFVDEVRSNTTKLADAVKAQTPVATEPPATPVEPGVEPEPTE